MSKINGDCSPKTSVLPIVPSISSFKNLHEVTCLFYTYLLIPDHKNPKDLEYLCIYMECFPATGIPPEEEGYEEQVSSVLVNETEESV